MGKVLSLLLVISFLGLSQNLVAGERHGAMLSVQKKDGHQENGELIAVKPSSLLLLDSASKADVSIDVSDINTIKIVRKSRAWSGLGLGTLIGGASGVLIVLASGDDTGLLNGFKARDRAILAGIAYGVVGGLVGLSAGALAGNGKTIQIGGKRDLEIRSALEKLKQKSRIPDFK
jgi:hypothetical protein